jgi:hypothetical protein
MERDTSAFTNDPSELAQVVSDITELHTPPSTTPFEIKLQKTPIDKTLRLLEPNYGSRGITDTTYPIAVGNGNKLTINLPFDIKLDYEKSWYLGVFGGSGPGYSTDEVEPQTILINGEEWTNELSSTSTATDTHYRLDFEANTLEFGDGTHGKAVPTGSVVSMYLQEERLFPSNGKTHIAELQYPTAADQDQVTIELVKPYEIKTSVLQPGATRHQLEKKVLADSIVFSDTVVFANKVTEPAKVDGIGKWYLNYETGALRSYSPTTIQGRTTATFAYEPRIPLTNNQWKFDDINGNIANAISIDHSAYQTFKIEAANPIDIAGVSYYTSLAHTAIVPGSVDFVTSSGVIASGVYGTEVQFVDGHTELLGVINTTEQISAITTVVAGTPTTITKSFNLRVSLDTSLEVKFRTSGIFQVDKTGGSISDVGDYSVDRASNQFSVRVDQNYSDPGIVTYYYPDTRTDLTGSYAINYEKGEVFFHDPTGGGDKVTYEYTHYIAKYPIAREISSEDWTFDKTNNKLSIKDREILRTMRIPQTYDKGRATTSRYYQVSYRAVTTPRDDVASLEPYFTPVLKDYALKIITASRMV